MTKFEQLRNIIVADCNRHRRQLGLEPVNYGQMECSAADEQAEASDGKQEVDNGS